MHRQTQSGELAEVIEDSDKGHECGLYIVRIVIDDFWAEAEEMIELLDGCGVVVDSVSPSVLDGNILD